SREIMKMIPATTRAPAATAFIRDSSRRRTASLSSGGGGVIGRNLRGFGGNSCRVKRRFALDGLVLRRCDTLKYECAFLAALGSCVFGWRYESPPRQFIASSKLALGYCTLLASISVGCDFPAGNSRSLALTNGRELIAVVRELGSPAVILASPEDCLSCNPRLRELWSRDRSSRQSTPLVLTRPPTAFENKRHLLEAVPIPLGTLA